MNLAALTDSPAVPEFPQWMLRLERGEVRRVILVQLRPKTCSSKLVIGGPAKTH
jgi:hypothetical protein